MDLRLFLYVTTLADEQSFSKAAAKLNISQSTLSQYIKKLEAEIGTTLFDRGKNTVVLTQSGNEYIKTARKILNMYGKTLQKISDVENSLIGFVSVGVSPTRSIYVMPQIIKKFREKFPNISVELFETRTSELMEALDEGTVDFCFIPLTQKLPEWYNVIPVAEEYICLYVSKDFKYYQKIKSFSENGEIDFSKLNGIPFIVLHRGQLLANEYQKLCESANTSPNTVCSVSELATAVALADEGIGATLITSEYAKYSKIPENSDFIKIKSNNTAARTLAVVTKKSGYLSNAAKTLTEIIKGM